MSLLERTTAGPKLTDAGRALVCHTDAIICRLDEAERELAAIAGLEGGRLRLVSFPTASATLLTKAVSSFRGSFPSVELQLGEARARGRDPRAQARRVRPRDHLRLRVQPRPSPIATSSCACCSRRRCRSRSRPGHPLTKRKAVKLEDLADEDWLTGVSQGSCRDHLILLCQAAGFDPKISFESDDYQVLQGLVSHRHGRDPAAGARARRPPPGPRAAPGDAEGAAAPGLGRRRSPRAHARPRPDAMLDVLAEVRPALPRRQARRRRLGPSRRCRCPRPRGRPPRPPRRSRHARSGRARPGAPACCSS